MRPRAARNAIAASALSNTLTGSSPTSRALGGGKVQPDRRSGQFRSHTLRRLVLDTARTVPKAAAQPLEETRKIARVHVQQLAQKRRITAGTHPAKAARGKHLR